MIPGLPSSVKLFGLASRSLGAEIYGEPVFDVRKDSEARRTLELSL